MSISLFFCGIVYSNLVCANVNFDGVLVHFEATMSHVKLLFLQEGLSKVHFTADRSQYASALYSAEEQAKQAKKKVSMFTVVRSYTCLIVCRHGLLDS